jgi:hypothetical protein
MSQKYYKKSSYQKADPIIKIIELFFSIILLPFRIFFKNHYSKINRAKIKNSWYKIKLDLGEKTENGKRSAIIGADRLLDNTMKEIGYDGDKMAERLKSAKEKFSNYDAIWKAHIARNKIVHEENYYLSNQDAIKHINNYQKALKDLGAL